MSTHTVVIGSVGALSATKFQQLAEVPAVLTWFANIDNPQTGRAYQNDVTEFMAFAGITEPEQFRVVARAHVLASGIEAARTLLDAPVATNLQGQRARTE